MGLREGYSYPPRGLGAAGTRRGTPRILPRLSGQARGVPFIVCSAGLGNVVRAVLRTRLPPEADVEALPIVSNWVRFEQRPDGEGTICGFTEPLLHMYNKNGATIKVRYVPPRLPLHHPPLRSHCASGKPLKREAA